MNKLAAVAALTLMTPCMACTFIWTDTVHPLQPPNPPLCRENWFAPTLDASVAGLLGAAAIVVATDSGQSRAQRQTNAILDGSVALLYAGVSVLGFVRTQECSEAHAEYERWAWGHGPLGDAVPSLPPPPETPLSEEEFNEQVWQQEQDLRFAAERQQFENDIRLYREAHPFGLASLRVTNATDSTDTTVAVLWQSEESAEHLETLPDQPLPAHENALFNNVLKRREGLQGRLLLGVHTATGEDWFELVEEYHPGATLHATLAWDTAMQQLTLDQVWE